MEAAFQFTSEFHENVLGFCNNIYNSEGGTHLTGFKTVFTTVMNNYARDLGILKEKRCQLYRAISEWHDSGNFHQTSKAPV